MVAKHFTDTGVSVTGDNYRGNVGDVLFNFDEEKFEVKKGDQMAQVICEWIFFFNVETEKVQVLDDTERGSRGFGSTREN